MNRRAQPRNGADVTPTKERILRIAAQLFARKGHDATGIAELGEAVGLGRGTLYHHIESKESLLFEISVEHVFDLVAFAEGLIDNDLPPEMKVRRLSRQLMWTIAENLPELTVFFHDFRALSPERAKTLADLRQRFEDAWLRLLEQGVEAGVFRPMHPVIVKGLLGMHNYSYLWLNPEGELRPDEISDIFCDAFLNGLRASGLR